MQFSIGLYALIFICVFILVPGYIARRFYFNGQFSKQMLWSSKSLSSLFYSLIIGVLIILIFIFILNQFISNEIDLDNYLFKFHINFISNNEFDYKKLNEIFSGISNNIKYTYLPFLTGLYLFSAFIGFRTCKLILYLGLDVKFKIFRFANEWYYLFNGKILKLENPTKNGFNNNLHVKHIYLDVLVKEGDVNTLYSGFFGDYDLSHKNYNKLEKLHLFKPSRYKKTDNGTIIKNIPGDIFTIFGENIININSTYVYQNEDDIKSKKFKLYKSLFLIVQFMSVLIFFFFTFYLLFPFKISKIHFLAKLLSQSIMVKLFFLFTVNISTGLITPYTINNKEMKIEFIGKQNFKSLLWFILLSISITYLSWDLSIQKVIDIFNMVIKHFN
jgi:hypothetical protein